MFDSINAAFNRAKNDIAEHNFIVESVLDVEEVLPGSEEEMDDEVDVDSVPDDVYAKIDKVIDKYVSSDKYDDTEAEELVDDDDYEDVDVSDEEINAIVSEAVSLWESCDEDDVMTMTTRKTMMRKRSPRMIPMTMRMMNPRAMTTKRKKRLKKT